MEREEIRDGVATYRILAKSAASIDLAGRVSDQGQERLKGTLSATLWIGKETLLWNRLEITTKWDDTGATNKATYVYSDYNKETVIKPPL